MNEKVRAILEELVTRYPSLAGQKAEIAKAYEILKNCYDRGGKLLIAGNGGSCADSEHIVGELMKGFCKKRPLPADLLARIAAADPDPDERLASKLQQGLPAIALTGHNALSTAFVNDVDAEYAFAQQIVGYGRQGDVFLGITTSGNSRNVLRAAAVAKAMELQVIALTGRDGGRIRGLADCAVIVPEQETFKIQELHLPVYHALCLMLEETYFSN
ncbi:MAG: SIS domain-containing protein [Lachnospiraceae bacterium]|nr:SIS domain-containing protein [Lachnospiraceae bacterium]